MKEDTAYNILKVGANPARAAAISKIFAIKEDTPEARAKVIADMEKAGLEPEAAEGLVKVFLDYAK